MQDKQSSCSYKWQDHSVGIHLYYQSNLVVYYRQGQYICNLHVFIVSTSHHGKPTLGRVIKTGPYVAFQTQIANDYKPCSTLEFCFPVLLSVSAILDTETTKKRQSISVIFWVIKFYNGWRESRIKLTSHGHFKSLYISCVLEIVYCFELMPLKT